MNTGFFRLLSTDVPGFSSPGSQTFLKTSINIVTRRPKAEATIATRFRGNKYCKTIEDAVQLGYPVPGGNKQRNLALQVGGVSKIETINCAHESRGTQMWKRMRWRRRAKTEIYRPDFSSERASPQQQTRNCLKIIKERIGKIVRGSQMGAWHQDRLADWLKVVT
jgi:hypothetical protein